MFKRCVAVVEALALLAAALFVVMLFAAPRDSDVAGRASDTADDGYLAETGALPTSGKELFASHCSRCHGPDGEGGTGPRLAGRVADEYPDIEDEIEVVTDGTGGMPSFQGTISDDDIRRVVEHTRSGL